MDRYTDLYMDTHCIDVFFTVDGLPIHVLTNGSKIPDVLNDIERNRSLQEKTEQLINARWQINRFDIFDLAEKMSESNDVTVNLEYCMRIQEQVSDSVKKRFSNQSEVSESDLYECIPFAEDIFGHYYLYASIGFYSYICDETHEDGTSTYILLASPHGGTRPAIELPNYHIEIKQGDIPISFRM